MTSGQSIVVQGNLRDTTEAVVFLPPAGSVTSPFLSVGALLPPSLPALHCELPGRGRLPHDEAPASVSAAVDRWTDDLTALLPEGRLHLFGHSLGALFAYELAARIEDHPRYEVVGLSVSGAREPGSAPRTLVAAAFEALRQDQRTTDKESDADGTWLTRDLHMRREHRITRQSVPAPLALFCGDSDPFARPADMTEWKRFTSGPFLGTFTFPGGHDYYLSGQAAIATTITNLVDRCRELPRTPVTESKSDS
ncbi:alpha/beta fold hydrolase [Streptomyces sp. NPDC005336]|uniref:thioesterase II family protein n=1 Tax=Streptomyces sp. NPDC005336 TaxID=3157035 RepID=UPI0033B40C64